MLPFGALLRSIRGTDNAVHIGYYSAEKYDGEGGRDHHWIAHRPAFEPGEGEFLSVRISTGVGGVSHVTFEIACSHLAEPEFYEWEMAVKETVPIERTPIPYKKESTLTIECPECDRFGTTHPWKLDEYLPDVCPCGYGGELDVR